ncbi:transcriptional regulator [Capsulimonas corticalis]|uniref:Transcriptional regulator n=1 Tax=Capsulimonas corticalis TaxID=2219043 RepID=A0A402D2Y5_9BACT|nr:YafY family protein [Capsulimonas corticalis]BDI28415.1 transcriptional regulator [Capsulimonas corticalis]
MYYPTTRVLTVLEMLQSHQSITGAEIAERLEVDIRTARRYIAMLEELGIPVMADRGRHGGYRLMPGFKLPPLMLNTDEALSIMLGLLAARKLGLAAHAPGVEGALAKVGRVLPDTVRDRVRAVEESLIWDLGERSNGGLGTSVVLALSLAAREHRQVALCYRRPDGETTERVFDPYGLVCRYGRWYATGHCHLRQDLRLFRLDRVLDAKELASGFERPKNFDVLAAVLTALGSVPKHFALEVVIHTSLEHARWVISAGVAVLEECEEGVLLRGYTENLDWIAQLLPSLGCRLDIRHPPELRDALRRHADQIHEWLETPKEPGSSRE